VYLNGTVAADRKKCCIGGMACEEQFPQLEYLPLELLNLLTNKQEHMSKASVYYNNMFQIGNQNNSYNIVSNLM